MSWLPVGKSEACAAGLLVRHVRSLAQMSMPAVAGPAYGGRR